MRARDGRPSRAPRPLAAVLERLKRTKIEDPVGFLDSPDCAIVIVSAMIRPGVRRDELVDVCVTLPDGSRAKSLRGGSLQPTPLMNFSTQGEVRDYLKQNDFNPQSEGNRVLRGHDVVIAKGLIQAALNGTDDAAAASDQPLKRGFVCPGFCVDGRGAEETGELFWRVFVARFFMDCGLVFKVQFVFFFGVGI